MEWINVKLTEISFPKQWKNLPSKKLKSTGYSVYGANGIIGYYHEYTHENPTLAITCRGATSGNIHLTLPKSYINSNAMALDNIDLSKYDLKFLFYAIKNRGLKDTISGSAQPQITRMGLSRVKLLVPKSLTDQKRIAKVLSTCEALIQKRKESMALLDEYVKSVFLEMFGDPVRNSRKIVTKKLSEISSVSRGKFTPRPRNDPKYFDGIYPFIQTGDISKADTYLVNYSQTLNELGKNVSKEFPKGTIVIALVGATIGETAILGINCYAPDSIVGIIPNSSDVNSIYLEYILRFWKPVLRARAPKAARANINNQTLRPLPIPVPQKEDLDIYTSIVERVEKIKINYANHLTELENLYGSLSQKAFKGELDLSQVEVTIEETKIETDAKKDEVQLVENAIKGIDKDLSPKSSNTQKEEGKKIKAVLEDISTQQIANWIRAKYTGYHFSSEMIIRFLEEEHGTFVNYYSSEELKKNPKLNEEDDLKSFIFSALDRQNPNPFIKLEQLFYDGLKENFQLEITEDDYELIKERTPEQRSGIYFKIIE